ncbi:MAG: PBP1A family penicillin-binding protein [Vicinamibacterales bacterium]
MARLSGFLRNFGLVALFVAAAVAGTASGVLFAFVGDLPQISALDDYSPSTITRVLGRDNHVIGDFATERRVVVTYDQIPPVLRNALVAAEDGGFYRHSGVNLTRIAATAIRRVLRLQHHGGASTITQQLARKLFLTDEQTLERKIKEALLALQIEKRYTKQEILTMFCNKMYWGHGAYGVEAASQLYFGKSVKDLTLDEAAMIAGIHQSNVRQSPYVNMKAAVSRRQYALGRMRDEGFITAAEYEAANARPIVTRGQPTQAPSIAPYFLETIREHLENTYGAKAVYENGLVVKTGLDSGLQLAANKFLDQGLRKIDKLHGFKKPARNILTEKRALDTYRHPRWGRDPAEGDITPALVLSIEGTDIHVRVGRFAGTIARAGYEWTRKKPQDMVARGDLVDVRIGKVDADHAAFAAQLDQTPTLEGAVLAIDNHTGQILAMVGGESFDRSQFNRAVQAMRQVGSLFKPFVYTAAIDRGYTTQSLLDDSPVSFNAGPGQPPYEPKNYDHEYHGMVTLRQALEGSRNVPTIRLMAALGPKQAVAYARQLGITAPLPEYLSVAIGSAEATLLEMTSAYSAFPNQGVRMQPQPLLEVIDRDGNTLEQHRTEPHEAIRADTAYIITNLLQGVVQHGTAAAANALNWPLGGKTGTTDDCTDAWFIGFDPDITLGVWVGFDQKRTIGNNQTGAVAALPVWMNIMRTYIDRRRAELPEPPEFTQPGNVVVVPLASGPEVFIAGTQPGARRE